MISGIFGAILITTGLLVGIILLLSVFCLHVTTGLYLVFSHGVELLSGEHDYDGFQPDQEEVEHPEAA